MMTAKEAEIPAIRSAFSSWYCSISEQERVQMQPFWKKIKEEAWTTIREIKDAINEVKTLNATETQEVK